MPDFSKSERYTVISFLILGLVWIGLSYSNKISSGLGIKTIEIKERRPPIDINTAGAGELERLPGIGPVLAQDIVAYRKKGGGFEDIDELKDVKGIGDKRLKKIRDLISISE
jgi:competence protein ComEA